MITPQPKLNSFLQHIKTTNTIIHIVPDFNTSLIDHLPNLAILTTNISNIVVRTNVFKVGPKRVNPKAYYSKLKALIPSTEFSRIRVVKQIKEMKKPSSIIVDHSKTSELIQYFSEKTSVKLSLFYLFDRISQEIKILDSELKQKADHIIVFSLSSQTGLLQVLSALKSVEKKDLLISYGNVGKGAFINISNENPSISMFMGYVSHKFQVTPSIFSKVKSRLPEDLVIDIIDDTEDSDSTRIDATISNNISGLIGRTDDKFVVNPDRLNNILKKVKVKNKNVESVINRFLEEEINSKKGSTLETSEIELTVLKAISFSLTGKVDEDKMANPEELIARLAESDVYSIAVKKSITQSNSTVSPSDMIPDDFRVSGINRHQFEYKDIMDKSVRDLFKSLSSRNKNPIKILKIKSETIRDNKNAYTVYTVTLQNSNGGETTPYDVTVKLPALVNDKYLLLGGKNYMPLTQQFLKPLVKDKKNEVRFLTQFNTDTLRIRNAVHSIGDYISLIELMETKYPDLISQIIRDDNGEISNAKFDNGVEFWRNSNDIIISTPKKIVRYADNKEETGIVIEYPDGLVEESSIQSEIELIFNEVHTVLTDAYPHESKISRQEPYIEIHTAGMKIPYIVFLWQKLGLLGALVKSGIEYKIVKNDDPVPENANIAVELDNGKVYLITDNIREEYIANGIMPFYRSNKFTISESDLSSSTAIDDIMRRKYRSSAIENLDTFNELMIDETTAKVLQKEGYPTNYLEVLNGPALDMLLNGQVDHPNDLKNLRARQAEIPVSLLYQEIGMAHAAYTREVARGNDKAKIRLSESFVIDTMLGKRNDPNGDSATSIEWIDPYSPVSELVHASKVIRTGPGGVPSTRQFRPEQRSIHKSAIGNISAHATPEYANVGVVTHNCLGVQVDKDGFYGGKVNDTDNEPFSSVSISEALVPFQNQMNSDRLIMAVTHMDQKLPINEGEPVLVGTGAEAIVPSLSSNKFIHHAMMDGVVKEVKPGKYIIVEYKNGKRETFDINYRSSHLAGDINILLDMETLQKGDKFKANQAISWTKNFSDNQLANGRNLVMAVMSKVGKNFEDGYSLSEQAANSMSTDILTSFSIRITKDMKIVNIITTPGTVLTHNSVVLERTYIDGEPDFAKVNDLENKELSIVKTKDTIKTIVPTGVITDVKIRINNKRGLDKTLLALFEQQSKEVSTMAKKLKGSKLDNLDLSVLNIGGHKDRGHLFEGALIEFFISVKTPLRHGDKISGRFGTKGVITDIIKGTPKGSYTDNIDIFISPLSIMGRKNTAVIKELYIGKIMYHAPRIFSELASNKSIKQVRDIIIGLFKILDTSHKKTNLKSIKAKLAGLSDAKLKKSLINKDIRFAIFYPPFTNISFKTIRAAADLLEIPLDEKVYIPSLKTWTKEAVPVGINYISRMEQLSDDKESTRSTGGKTLITGQPRSGKANNGGQSISEQDIYAMLNYGSPEILRELTSVRSDNITAGVSMMRSLTTTGHSKLSDLDGIENVSKTSSLLDSYMVGMGLKGRGI